MKPEDIFEIFADIDEKMVAEAKENFFEDNGGGKGEEYTAEPVIVSAPRKSFPWKTAAAACIALICAAGVGIFALAVRNGQGMVISGGAEGTDLETTRPVSAPAETEADADNPAAGDSEYLKPEKKYDLNETPEGWNETFEFDMPEFPEVKFFRSSDSVKVEKNGQTAQLYMGMPVWDVYLCDLNGDGKREICSNVSFGSGIVDNRIMVFDYENAEMYELSDRGNFDYSICGFDSEQEENALLYTRVNYNEMPDGTEKKEKLTLDIMKKVSYGTLFDGDLNAYVVESAEAGEDSGEASEENIFAEYESFGLVLVKGKLYYEDKPVRYFVDYYLVDEDGNTGGTDYFDADGIIDAEAVRDLEDIPRNEDGSFDPRGKLTGIKTYPIDNSPVPDMITGTPLDFVFSSIDDASHNNSVNIGNAENSDHPSETNQVAMAGYSSPEEARKENLKNAEEYKPFGVTYDPEEDQWYFHGERVRYFRDVLTSNGEPLSSGKFKGSMRTLSGNGTVDIYTVRDFGKPDGEGKGTLTDIKASADGEIDLY